MAKRIAVVNQKGGVGKTTTSVNLAASLAYYGQRVLLIDMDSQANATSGLGIDKRTVEGTVYQLLTGVKNLRECIHSTALEKLKIIPSHIDLIGAEIELIHTESREQILKNHLQQLDNDFDFMFIDCPPSLGLLTLNALCAAHSVLIPMQCEYYALEGMSQLIDTIGRVQQILNPQLEIEGLLLTMFDSRAKLSNDVVAEIRKAYPNKTYETVLTRNVRLAEAPGFGQAALLYDFASRGAQSYLQLAREFLSKHGITLNDAKDAQ